MKTRTIHLLLLAALFLLSLPARAWSFYNPSQGRWFSRDPIGTSGGINEQSFVANRPVSRHDILGQRIDPIVPRTDHRCDDPCEDARRQGLAWNPKTQRDDWGGIVCCQGVKYKCSWGPFSQNTGANGVFATCNDVHEDTHLNDVRCPCIWQWGWPTRPNLRIGLDLKTEECEAFRAELACITANRGNCGGDQACEDELTARMTFIVNYMLGALGCSP